MQYSFISALVSIRAYQTFGAYSTFGTLIFFIRTRLELEYRTTIQNQYKVVIYCISNLLYNHYCIVLYKNYCKPET
jgi:hypothetical protein